MINYDEILNNVSDKSQDKNTTSRKFKRDLLEYFSREEIGSGGLKALELGCSNGYSTFILSHLFKKVFAVDKDPNAISIAKEVNKNRANIEFYTDDVYSKTFECPSDVRIIWIDAGHDYSSIKYDVERFTDNLNDPYIIFDDYAHPNVGVKQVVSELVESGAVESIHYIGELGKDLISAKGTIFRPDDPEGVILKLKRKKDIIFMLNIKLSGDGRWSSSRSEPYKYSIASWQKWAEKNNSDVILLEDLLMPIEEMGICWQRYYMFQILEGNGVKYNQILMVDADTIIHPDTPNFFDMTKYDFAGAHFAGSWDWVLRSIENYSKFIFGGSMINYWEYMDAGFFIVNKMHKKFYDNILQFYLSSKNALKEMEKFHGGTDQTPVNFLLQMNNIPRIQLPYSYNMVDMNRKEILTEDLLFTKIGFVYQFNAIPNNENNQATNYWMKKTYEYFYGELK